MLTPSKTALNLIKHYEGLSLRAYPDPGSGGDPWTIGYGATGAGIKQGVVWTLEQAEARLLADVKRFAAAVASVVGLNTTQNEFDAMVVFAYNVGAGALRSSTLLKLHLKGDKKGAAAQFLRWDKAKGKVMRGLTIRRKNEMELYLS